MDERWGNSMIQTIKPGMRQGCVRVPASKSQAHRLLICAALSKKETVLICDGISEDVEATIRCLEAMGAKILRNASNELRITPIHKPKTDEIYLDCGESGSTFRFLLPLAGALGLNAVFHRRGNLTQRPIEPLLEELREHGMSITSQETNLYCSGKLNAGRYFLPGNISSQFASGLFMALPLLEDESTLTILGKVESAQYIDMTLDTLTQSGFLWKHFGSHYRIPGKQRGGLYGRLTVEADWSSAAVFLCMGALSEEGVTVKGLNLQSQQGDCAIWDVLAGFGAHIALQDDTVTVSKGELNAQSINAAQIPDLIPALCMVAAVSAGETRILHAERLRFKESDRLQSTAQLLKALGVEVTETRDGLRIQGQHHLNGGTVNSCNDHRIAMAAAVAASACYRPVNVINAEVVAKSYPRFWDDFQSLEVI